MVSPGLVNRLQIKSNALDTPLVTNKFCASTGNPYPLLRKSASASPNGPSPCSAPYCRKELSFCEKRACAASRIRSSGKSERGGGPRGGGKKTGGDLVW